MRASIRGKLLAVMMICLTSSRGWSQVADEQARILTLEHIWNHSVQAKDIAALQMLFGPDLVYVDYAGKSMDRAEYLTSVRSETRRPTRIVSESMRVHLYGSMAVVDGVYRESGLKSGKPYVLRERFIDTWVRDMESWVCVASESTLIGP